MGTDQGLQLKERVKIEVTPIEVTVINASEYLSKQEYYVEHIVMKALQTQVDTDFARAWGITAKLNFIGWENGQKFSKVTKCESYNDARSQRWLVLLDSSDISGFGGYHEVTPEGMPIGKVFAQIQYDYDRDWTTSASHELLEMLVDPGMNLTVFRPTNEAATSGQLYAYEVCDPCDADNYTIRVSCDPDRAKKDNIQVVDDDKVDIKVSNFVYPAWFEWFHEPNPGHFDHINSKEMDEPFKLAPGGFINVLDMPNGRRWRQISKPPESGPTMCYRYRLRSPTGSRRAQRRILGTGWPGGGEIGGGP